MGDRDLIKPLLERRGTVHYGRVKVWHGHSVCVCVCVCVNVSVWGEGGERGCFQS
jgi:hypothetical protein